MTDKEKLMVIQDISQLQIEIMNRFNVFISEQVVRRGITKEDIERFKSSVDFAMDERLGFINRKISQELQ